MKNFLHGICGFPGDFTIQNRQAKCIEYIKERVGDQKVLVTTYDYYSPSIELYQETNLVNVKILTLKIFLYFKMLLSGGVDSTVCAALMRQALNEDQIIAIHIDNGFMRKRESENVRDSLAKIGIQVKGRTI